MLSRWVGGSEKGIREVFKKAKLASPCIIFFDEIDAIAPIRGTSADSHVIERVISQLLTELDGIEELKGVVVLAASNRPDIIDPALLRAGRFDFQLELPIPDERARLEILKVHTRGKPLADDVDFRYIAEMTEGMVGSEIEAVSNRASLLTIREFIDQEEKDLTKFKVSLQHFIRALETMESEKGTTCPKLPHGFKKSGVI